VLNTEDEILICIERGNIPKKKNQLLYDTLDNLNTGLMLDETLKEQPIVLAARNLAEDKKYLLQLIVATVIRCGDKFVVLETISGRMKGTVTMVQGHVSYDRNFYDMKLIDILQREISRELYEEISINNQTLFSLSEPKLKFFALNNTDDSSVDFYHLGCIFEINIDKKYKDLVTEDNFTTKEPEKHNVKVINIHDNLKKKGINCCSWLKAVIDYYRK
jgi:predicted NUDIX family phosphoesterase